MLSFNSSTDLSTLQWDFSNMWTIIKMTVMSYKDRIVSGIYILHTLECKSEVYPQYAVAIGKP